MSIESRSLPSDEVPPESDHMWPLDLALVALGGSLMYLAATRLGWDDPRWMYNAKTYAIAIPAGLVLIDLLLRNVASRFMQRSLQFGFLVSMFVHLIMLILAVNVVIFARYWPESVVGVQPETAPVRKSLPDNLFQTNPNAVAEQPDWSRPVDAASEARVTPLEAQRVQRLQDVTEQLQMPVKPEVQHEPTPFLMEQQQPTEAEPTPADAPSKLARQQAQQTPELQNQRQIETPELQQQQQQRQSIRSADVNVARSRARGASASAPRAAPEMQANFTPSPSAVRSNRPAQEAPRIAARSDAESMVRRQRDIRRNPALSAPTVPSIAVARTVENSPRQIADRSVGIPRRATSAAGVSLAPSASTLESISNATGASSTPSALAQRSQGTSSQPVIAGGSPSSGTPFQNRTVGRGQLAQANMGTGRVAIPNLSGNASSQSADGDQSSDQRIAARGNAVGRADSQTDLPSIAAGAPSPLAINAETGPAGLAEELAPRAGMNSDQPNMQPMISVQPKRERFRRRPLGGMTPRPSEKVASVEPFRRRLMRTAGGAAPAPAGLVGPETEEAIERGLAFLASRQNDDGSWTLQGQGEEVLLKSDSAATALCVLAFQGAGYTHLKNQYAGTVARGLAFLKKNQKENGDLYRPQDETSNKACWLYSHSIAALSICEAFGMTQDPEYAEPAQKAIDFIVASQHPERGGWRYRPQASSDMSVTGWMMMALKSGELAGLEVPEKTYKGIEKWLSLSQDVDGKPYLFRYNPYALNTPAQRHGRDVSPTMTAVGLLIRLYMGWRRDNPNMQAGANYLRENLPEIGSATDPKRDTYYWYYATQVMFHMGGETWKDWNDKLYPLLIRTQLKDGPENGSWDPVKPIPDRWSPYAGRVYLTTLNLLSLEVYYRRLPIYEDTAR